MSFVRTLSATVFLTFLAISPVLAETFEVKMLNQGEKGSMVFEPDFLASTLR